MPVCAIDHQYYYSRSRSLFFSFANFPSAICPRCGAAACALLIRSLKSHQKLIDFFQKASISLKFCGSISLWCLSFPQNVARPENADNPAPMSAKMRCDHCKVAVKDVKSSREILRNNEGRVADQNLRLACFTLSASEDLEVTFWNSFNSSLNNVIKSDDRSASARSLTSIAVAVQLLSVSALMLIDFLLYDAEEM
jgi:hypothetical protein